MQDRIKKAFSNMAFTIAFIGSFAILAIYILSLGSIKQNADRSVELVKRLDDIGNDENGKTQWMPINQEIARVKEELKIAPVEVAEKTVKPVVRQDSGVSNLENIGEIEYSLADLYNAHRYKQRPSPENFSGSITMRNGNIESLSVSLPFNEQIDIQFSEVRGNAFTFLESNLEQRGVIFKTGTQDKMELIVSINGGRFNGTRLKFMAPFRLAEYQQQIMDQIKEQQKKPGAVLASQATKVAPKAEAMVLDENELDFGANQRIMNMRQFGQDNDIELAEDELSEMDEVEIDMLEAELEEELEAKAEKSGFDFSRGRG